MLPKQSDHHCILKILQIYLGQPDDEQFRNLQIIQKAGSVAATNSSFDKGLHCPTYMYQYLM